MEERGVGKPTTSLKNYRVLPVDATNNLTIAVEWTGSGSHKIYTEREPQYKYVKENKKSFQY